MRRSEWEDRCKKHPDHRLSKGVCPYCLREKLSHLSASSSTTNTTHVSSSSANNSIYSSNSNISSGKAATSSPPQVLPEGIAPNPNPNTEALQKSRSLAFEMKEEKEAERKKKKKKIERFFSRIIHGDHGKKNEKGESNELFQYSKTMKEKSSTKWVLF